MLQAEIIGIIVIGLSALVTLFMAIYKPLNENTKAMTTLTSNIEHLTEKIEEQSNRINEQELAFSRYKDNVRESQKRQWDVLDEHERMLMETKHKLEMCQKENERGVKNV